MRTAFPVPLFLLTILLAWLSGCAQRPVQDFADTKPEFRLEEFFDGEVLAYGIFEDRFGRLQRQFKVNIMGVVEGDTLTLTEDFLYDDGETQQRIWTIIKEGNSPDGTRLYTGTAADVIGSAEGEIAGSALFWSYAVDLAMGDSSLKVRFDDWIYQMDQHVALNRATISKFGIEIGTVTLVFLRGPAAAAIGPHDLQNWSG